MPALDAEHRLEQLSAVVREHRRVEGVEGGGEQRGPVALALLPEREIEAGGARQRRRGGEPPFDLGKRHRVALVLRDRGEVRRRQRLGMFSGRIVVAAGDFGELADDEKRGGNPPERGQHVLGSVPDHPAAVVLQQSGYRRVGRRSDRLQPDVVAPRQLSRHERVAEGQVVAVDARHGETVQHPGGGREDGAAVVAGGQGQGRAAALRQGHDGSAQDVDRRPRHVVEWPCRHLPPRPEAHGDAAIEVEVVVRQELLDGAERGQRERPRVAVMGVRQEGAPRLRRQLRMTGLDQQTRLRREAEPAARPAEEDGLRSAGVGIETGLAADRDERQPATRQRTRGAFEGSEVHRRAEEAVGDLVVRRPRLPRVHDLAENQQLGAGKGAMGRGEAGTPRDAQRSAERERGVQSRGVTRVGRRQELSRVERPGDGHSSSVP